MSEESTSLWSIIDLPSKFRAYKIKECKIRPLKVGEVRRIESALDGSAGVSVLDVIKDAVSFPVMDLTLGDFWFILAWLRINTYRNYPVVTDWTCKNGHQNRFILDLTKITITELPEEYVEPLILTIGSEKIPMKLARAGDQEVAKAYLKKFKDDGNYTPEELAQASQAIQIDNNSSLFERIKYLKNLEDSTDGPEIILSMKSIDEEFAHGLPRVVEDKCAKCDASEGRIIIAFRLRDLAPRDILAKNIRSAVSFSKVPARVDSGES